MITYTHTNNTNEYQLVGNYKDVLASGTKEEMLEKMKPIVITDTGYGVIAIVEPGQTVSGDFVEGIDISLDKSKDWAAELFAGAIGGAI